MVEFRFFATAAFGLETLLADELSALACTQVAPTKAGVGFCASLATAYEVCLKTRFASRILLEVAVLDVESVGQLSHAIAQINWQDHIDHNMTFVAQFTGRLTGVRHNTYGAQMIKDGVVDYFRECGLARPDVSLDDPDVRILVHCYKRKATVSIDFSGPIHKRGYRLEGGKAPLRETLASAIIHRSGWQKETFDCLLDPMCGSGTLLIEAAYEQLQWPRGLLKQDWQFDRWKKHDSVLWQSTRERLMSNLPTPDSVTTQYVGIEIDPAVAKEARANVERAGLSSLITVINADVFDKPVDSQLLKVERGLLVCNLPYGERVDSNKDIPVLYSMFGELLASCFSGWQVSLLMGDEDLAKKIPYRWEKRYQLKNGPLSCALFNYLIQEQHKLRRFDPYHLTEQWESLLSDNGKALKNRLIKNEKRLRKWRKKESVQCYRIYDADIPEYAAAIDVYGDCVHVQEYQAPKSIDAKVAKHRLDEIVQVCVGYFHLTPSQISVKTRSRQSGNLQYQRLSSASNKLIVQESDLSFYVNLTDYLDTGLFLDHRRARQMLRERAKGKRFLNLFAYTGSASVYAASGGAKQTVTVDLSKTYLQWAKENMALNRHQGAAHSFINADCVEWIANNRQKFDLIFLDPPTFSNSKKMSCAFDLQEAHADLVRYAMNALTRDGELVFSNNYQKFKMDTGLLDDFAVQEVSKQTISPDFERNRKIHNCWSIKHKQ